jgi:hypothetical protein
MMTKAEYQQRVRLEANRIAPELRGEVAEWGLEMDYTDRVTELVDTDERAFLFYPGKPDDQRKLDDALVWAYTEHRDAAHGRWYESAHADDFNPNDLGEVEQLFAALALFAYVEDVKAVLSSMGIVDPDEQG